MEFYEILKLQLKESNKFIAEQRTEIEKLKNAIDTQNHAMDIVQTENLRLATEIEILRNGL